MRSILATISLWLATAPLWAQNAELPPPVAEQARASYTILALTIAALILTYLGMRYIGRRRMDRMSAGRAPLANEETPALLPEEEEHADTDPVASTERRIEERRQAQSKPRGQ